MLTSLPVPDKIKLATLGRREQRAILVRDPNRIVSTAVLSSPKLTDTEVENFARMQNVSDEVLRLIGTSRAWTKNYAVVSALVKNPRTPTAVSMPLLTRLVERDLKGLAVDRNVPESVRLAARKQLSVLRVAQVLTATAASAASTSACPLPGCRLPAAGSLLPFPAPGCPLPALRVAGPLAAHLRHAVHEHGRPLAVLVVRQLLEEIDGRVEVLADRGPGHVEVERAQLFEGGHAWRLR